MFFQKTSDGNFNYITIILETWIYLWKHELLNNVTKKDPELSVGNYKMVILNFEPNARAPPATQPS